MLRVGDLVYFDADEERHYHALHMTVGRVADEDVHDAKPIYVCFSHAGFEKWIGVERLRPCIGSRGPYFVGDMVYGVILRTCEDNCAPEWCTCHSVGRVSLVRARGVDVDFGHDRGGRIIRMRRSDIRLATKGPAHLRHEELLTLVKPAAGSCRRVLEVVTRAGNRRDRMDAIVLALVKKVV